VAALVASTNTADPAFARAKAASFNERHPLHSTVASAYSVSAHVCNHDDKRAINARDQGVHVLLHSCTSSTRFATPLLLSIIPTSSFFLSRVFLCNLFQAWLGFYNSNLRKLGWTPAQLVQRANHLAACWGFPKAPPPLQKKTVGKMGLKGVPGLNIQ